MHDVEATDLLLTSQVARMLGVSVQSIHAWDRTGRLLPTMRTATGVRLYARADVEALRLKRARCDASVSRLDAQRVEQRHGAANGPIVDSVYGEGEPGVETRNLSRAGAADAVTGGPADDGEKLATISRGADRELRIRWRSFEGHPYLDLREWTKSEDGVAWPTKKGITIKPRELPAVLEAVTEAARLAS